MRAILLLLLLSGCASTRFYHQGQLVLQTQANAEDLVVTSSGELRVRKLDHSTPTEAGGDLMENAIGAAVGGISAWRLGR